VGGGNPRPVAVAPALWGTTLDGAIDLGALDAEAQQQQAAFFLYM
jgi:hypothetical protein